MLFDILPHVGQRILPIAVDAHKPHVVRWKLSANFCNRGPYSRAKGHSAPKKHSTVSRGGVFIGMGTTSPSAAVSSNTGCLAGILRSGFRFRRSVRIGRRLSRDG